MKFWPLYLISGGFSYNNYIIIVMQLGSRRAAAIDRAAAHHAGVAIRRGFHCIIIVRYYATPHFNPIWPSEVVMLCQCSPTW